MPQPNVDFPSEIVGEAGQLRALARCLVRGEDADDLAQDALVTALSQPRRPRALRPWLRQVLRNEHRASARKEMRRRRREESAPPPEPGSTPDDVAERAELVAAVGDALLELDEPYRVVLQQRFFSDRTAVDIARSEGCPAGTVRWRVQEGLRRVRRKLDERFDGRAQWLGGMMVIAGVPWPPAAPPPATGGSTMTKAIMLKVLAGAAVVVGGTAVVAGSSLTSSDEATQRERPAAVADYQASMQTAATPESETPRAADDEPLLLSRNERVAAHDDEPTPTEAEHERDRLRLVANANDKLADCFAGVELTAGETFDVVAELSLQKVRPDKAFVVTSVRFDQERLAGIDGLGKCTAEALDAVLSGEIDGDEVQLKLPITVGEDGKLPELTEMRLGKGRSEHVDADAPDPEAIAKELGLAPRGAAQPKIRIVECSDYDCPYCKKARATVDQIVADYGDRVAVYRLENPLPFHTTADPAARAALAAGEQGKYWEMSDLLYDDLDRRARADFIAYAEELDLDIARFEADMDSEETGQTIDKHRQTCLGNGARGTPSFFINGDILVGARPYDAFKAMIDDELAD